MHIQKTFEVRRVHTTRGTENNHAAVVLTLACRLDRISPQDRGVLMGYQDEEIQVSLEAATMADPAEPRPLEKLWSSNGQEHTRPGPTESCSECGRVIGEDPDADFYAPLAGPSRPVCGACKQAIEDAAVAGEAIDDDDEEIVAVELVEDEPIGDRPMPERPADQEPITTPIRRR